MNTQLGFKELTNFIKVVGKDVTVIIQGEPGIGKSALLPMVAQHFPEHEVRYFDAALPPDSGDIQIPDVDKKGKKFSFIPNELFMSDKPIIIMLDELGKASRQVQNALLPLLLEKRVGSYKLHPDSIVFGTTNLTTDGVGDNIQAHSKNRGCWVTMRKPTGDEWVQNFATDNDIDPAIQKWVSENPHCMASYTDPAQADNPYIFNPKKMQAAFVTPRSLEKASHISKQRMHLAPDTFIAGLAGTLGESAARDLQAYMTLADGLPLWANIIKEPLTTEVPTNVISQSILAIGAATRLDKTCVNPWLIYMDRLAKEVQALFVTQVMGSSKSVLLVSNKNFTAWVLKNNYMF